LIVVDASHGNETFELADRWFQRSKYLIKCIRAKPGLTRQTNIGIRNSGGSYLFFFDDDVVLDSKFIQVVYETFMKLEEQNMGDITGRIANTLGKQFD
jgi:glycosyltransferase involved in cell wall biosynthesis